MNLASSWTSTSSGKAVSLDSSVPRERSSFLLYFAWGLRLSIWAIYWVVESCCTMACSPFSFASGSSSPEFTLCSDALCCCCLFASCCYFCSGADTYSISCSVMASSCSESFLTFFLLNFGAGFSVFLGWVFTFFSFFGSFLASYVFSY